MTPNPSRKRDCEKHRLLYAKVSPAPSALRAGLPLMEVLLIQLIGSVYAEMTNYAEAQKSYEMAAARGKEIGCALELAKIHGLQAQLAHRQGDRARAIESAGLADAVLHHAGIGKGETVASWPADSQQLAHWRM
jgi:hypothetical protein